MKGFDSKSRRPGRYNPNYHPSGKGSYNCRWRKEERRERAVARQKALCESGEMIQVCDHFVGCGDCPKKKPMDWKMMLLESQR